MVTLTQVAIVAVLLPKLLALSLGQFATLAWTVAVFDVSVVTQKKQPVGCFLEVAYASTHKKLSKPQITTVNASELWITPMTDFMGP